MITIDTFSEENRDRQIGHSQYRICRQQEPPHNWYIHEAYNEYPDGDAWSIANGFYTDSLQEAINTINGFTKEREVVDNDRKAENHRRHALS